MAWFEGSVDEAVKICKQRAGLLTIFIRDTSDESHVLEGIFAEAEVTNIFSSKHNDILLLKITQGTNNFDLLNSVYPVASVPMIQFIDGSNGMLLFSVQPSNKEDIIQGLNEGIDTWLHQRPAPAAPRPTPADMQHPTSSQLHSSATATATQVRSDDSSTAGGDSDLQARVARAQERAIEIRKEKEKEAERVQREKEIQRRKDGQLTATAERERQLAQAEQIRLDIEKERKQEAAHRQRVLDNLRQDREEREQRQRESRNASNTSSDVRTDTSTVRTGTNPLTNPSGNSSANPSGNSSGNSSANPSSGADYSKAKIQFRHETAEGMRSFIEEFEAEEAFEAVLRHVKRETGLSGGVTLRQLYPRRDFSSSDGKTSLKTLGLVPNGVLLIIPANSGRTGQSGGSPGFLANILATVVKILQFPLQGINRLIGFVFPRPPVDDGGARRTTYSASNATSERVGGNVHRRRPTADDVTYNGNSTQQM